MNDSLHPAFAATGSFEHLKLGKKPFVPGPKLLRLEAYTDLEKLLPQIPETFDRRPVVTGGFPMYGNDRLGDCTWAGIGHAIQDLSFGAGQGKTPLDSDIQLGYWETGDPPATTGEAGGPTDDGRDEQSVLSYWINTGTGGDKLGAFAFIDPTNHDHMRIGMYIFGVLYTGTALPLSAQSQGQLWDVVGDGKTGNSEAGSWGGHCYTNRPKWDGKVLQLVTWGYEMEETLAFSDTYKEEAYVPISSDWLKGGKSIDGLDMQQLASDAAAITDQAHA